MPALPTHPVAKFFTGFDAGRLKLMLKSAGHRFQRASAPRVHDPIIRTRQNGLLGTGSAGLHQRAEILRFTGRGPTPTIVLGGFVPDATESVFMLRKLLERHGAVYCVNYPSTGFSIDLLFAQLDDLVEELDLVNGREPVVFAVSFGAGLALEWLRRRRLGGGRHALRGLVLVSPVACVNDLIPAGASKGNTLLGRAIAPYLGATEKVDEKVVERSRAIFGKMFEAGAQNKEALAGLMAPAALYQLRDRVMGTIRSINFRGAVERVDALKTLLSPASYFIPGLLPLSEVPTLVLYAEKEDSVLDEAAPSRSALVNSLLAYFPRGRCLLVRNKGGSPVQHASLIFHHGNFAPQIGAFYKRLRGGWLKGAAA